MSDNDAAQPAASEASQPALQPESAQQQPAPASADADAGQPAGEPAAVEQTAEPADAPAEVNAGIEAVVAVETASEPEPERTEVSQTSDTAQAAEAFASQDAAAAPENAGAPQDSATPEAAPTAVVPLPAPVAEEPTQVVSPQATQTVPPQPAQQPAGSPVPASLETSGAYPTGAYPTGAYPSGAYPNQPPVAPVPGRYPGQAGPWPPQQGQYQQTVGLPPRPSGPPPVNGYDAVTSLFDAVRALAAGYVSTLIAALVVIYAGFSQAKVGVGSVFRFSAWLLGASLGTPITGSMSMNLDFGGDSGDSGDSGTSGFGGFDASGSTVTAGYSVRLTVWAVTVLVLFILYRFARRREAQVPSRSLGQLFLRSGLTALAVSLILLIVALSTKITSLPVSDSLLGGDTPDSGVGGVHVDFGLGVGYVFLGPLLLTLAVGLLGRFRVWLHAPTTTDPRAERAKTLINQWTPAARVARRQVAVMGTLIGVGIWIWLAVDVFQDPTSGPYRTGILLLALVLLPNLAVYGSLIGMGVTMFAGGAFGMAIASQAPSTSDGLGADPFGQPYALGIFQGAHPWGIWLLLGGVLVGTLAPAVLARTTRRFAVNRDDYTLNGAWRSILIGLAVALVVVLLGALSLGVSSNEGTLGSASVSLSIGPSLLGALGLSALWFLLAYLALSLSLGHRFQPVTPRQPSGIPPQGTPEYAQYAQYQQYLQQQQMLHQQQYPQGEGQGRQPAPAPAPGPVMPDPAQAPTPGQTVTVPLAQPQPTQVTQQIGVDPAAPGVPGQTVPGQAVPGTEQTTQPVQQPEQPTQFVQPTTPTTPLDPSAEQPTQVVPAGPESSGTHEIPAESNPADTVPFDPAQQPLDPAQQYAQQYPQQYAQQYAQPYPGQPYPAQWAAVPGQPGQPGPWMQQPAMPGQPAPRKRFQPKLVIPLVVILLAGGGFLAYHLASGNSGGGPSGAVTAYFNDLAAGDAKDAAALAEGPYGGSVITSAATLADAANRPANFSVVSTRKPTATEQAHITEAKFAGTNPTVVIVKYTVRGKQLTDTFLAMQNTQGKWVLPSPYMYITVSGGWSDKATVDGVSFSASDGVGVFPGAHVVDEPKNPDFKTAATTIVPQDTTQDGETYAGYGSDADGEITFPTPTLSTQGQQAVQKAYSDALEECASEAESGTGDCGLDDTYDYYTCNNVTWTITTVGDVNVDLSSAESDGSFDWTADDTVASESGDYTDEFGDDQTFSDEPADLQNDGTVVFNSDGTATITINE